MDVQTKNYMIKDLHALWQEAKKTIVMVTHSVQEAVLMADRVVVFGNRPSGIVHQERIELPHPRQLSDPQLVQQMQRVTDALLGQAIQAFGDRVRRRRRHSALELGCDLVELAP